MFKRRSHFGYALVVLDSIIGLIAFILLWGGPLKYVELAVVLVPCSLVFEIGLLVLVMHFFPKVKKWWFGMPV